MPLVQGEVDVEGNSFLRDIFLPRVAQNVSMKNIDRETPGI